MKTIKGRTYTTKEDLQGGLRGIEQYAPHVAGRPHLFFRMTSGTTRGTFTMFVSRFPNKTQLRFYLDKFAQPLLILHPKHCTAMQWACLFFDTHAHKGRILVLDKKALAHPQIASILAEFEPTHVYGFPAVLTGLIDSLSKAGKEIFGAIESTLLIGEKLRPAVVRTLQAALPHSEIFSAYATAEARIIGVPCQALMHRYPDSAFQVFHPVAEGDVHIVAPDGGGVGEIVVLTPELSHYLTGDAGKITDEVCSCGATQTLTVYGRIAFDVVHCVGATFHISEVERVLASPDSFVEDFYLEIREVEGGEKTRGFITAHIVPAEKLRTMNFPERYIRDYLESHLQVTKTRFVQDLVAEDIFMPTKVILVPSIAHPVKKIHMRKIESPPED